MSLGAPVSILRPGKARNYNSESTNRQSAVLHSQSTIRQSAVIHSQSTNRQSAVIHSQSTNRQSAVIPTKEGSAFAFSFLAPHPSNETTAAPLERNHRRNPRTKPPPQIRRNARAVGATVISPALQRGEFDD
jgi:hypothetical protein